MGVRKDSNISASLLFHLYFSISTSFRPLWREGGGREWREGGRRGKRRGEREGRRGESERGREESEGGREREGGREVLISIV